VRCRVRKIAPPRRFCTCGFGSACTPRASPRPHRKSFALR